MGLKLGFQKKGTKISLDRTRSVGFFSREASLNIFFIMLFMTWKEGILDMFIILSIAPKDLCRRTFLRSALIPFHDKQAAGPNNRD